MLSGTGHTFTENTIHDNDGVGVDIEGGSDHLLTGNTIADNAGRGVYIHGSATDVTVGGLDEGEPNTLSGNDDGDDALVFGGGTGHFLLSNSIQGDVEIWSGASVSGAGEVTGDADMSNAGTFTVVNLAMPYAFELSGDFTQLAGGTTVVTGLTTLGGTGTVDLQGGTFIIEQGTVIAPNGLTIDQGAVLRAGTAGTATLVADVTNAGTIDVGGTGFIGTLFIVADVSLGVSGDYTQTATGTLHMELAGFSDYDRVSIAGQATLGGVLDVDLVGGYTPVAPDSFTLLTYGLRSGQFASIDLPSLPAGREFEWAYQSGAFLLWVTEDFPGMGG